MYEAIEPTAANETNNNEIHEGNEANGTSEHEAIRRSDTYESQETFVTIEIKSKVFSRGDEAN